MRAIKVVLTMNRPRRYGRYGEDSWTDELFWLVWMGVRVNAHHIMRSHAHSSICGVGRRIAT